MSATKGSLGKIRRPSLFWFFTESGRALTEYGTFFPFQYLRSGQSVGDGHPVLIIPGFMASDVSTKPLRRYLTTLGYEALPWGMGRNTGRVEFIDELGNKLTEVYQTYREPVSIIGWSLGGVFARQVAKIHPDYVRQLITLGSPFAGISEPNNVAWVYNWFTGKQRVQDIDPSILEDLPKPAPVPTTAVYTKQDGIVPWQICREIKETPIHQNIQVRGSHLGLGVNPTVLNIISDRLAYTKDNWEWYGGERSMEQMLLYPSC